jgi:predicted CopG family antitoxin
VTTTINVTFEDDDYELLKETKDEDETWHDWLLRSAELRRREVN